MAFVHLTPTSEVHTAWFLGWRGRDVMAMVYRDSVSSQWRGVFRIREHAGPEPWDDADQVRGWQVQEQDDPLSIVERFDDCVQKFLEAQPAGELTRVEVKGSADDFLTVWRQQPFCHVKIAVTEPGLVQ